MDVDEDLDLSHLLRPVAAPSDGGQRARRTARRRQVVRRSGVAALAALVVIGGSIFAASGPDGSGDKILATSPPSPSAFIVEAARPDRPTTAAIVDLESGVTRRVPLPFDGEHIATVISRTGGIVLLNRPDPQKGGEVWVLRPPYTNDFRRIADATAIVPSARSDRVWLVLNERPGKRPYDPDAASIVEVDLEGAETTSELNIPCCRKLVGDSEHGPLMATDTDLEVWNPETNGPSATFAGLGYISMNAISGGDTIVHGTTNDEGCLRGDVMETRLAVLDLGTGEDRPLNDNCYEGVARYSPDHQYAAIWKHYDTVVSNLYVVNLADGTAVEVPDSVSDTGAVAWGPDGVLYYYDTFDGSIRSYDRSTGVGTVVTRTNEIVTWIVGAP